MKIYILGYFYKYYEFSKFKITARFDVWVFSKIKKSYSQENNLKIEFFLQSLPMILNFIDWKMIFHKLQKFDKLFKNIPKFSRFPRFDIFGIHTLIFLRIGTLLICDLHQYGINIERSANILSIQKVKIHWA